MAAARQIRLPDYPEPRTLNPKWYYILIRHLYGQPPVQIVLYVGHEPTAMPATLNEPNLRFQYQSRDIREFEADSLLESPSLDDNLLAILGRFEDSSTVIRRILERIAGLSSRKRRDYLTKLWACGA